MRRAAFLAALLAAAPAEAQTLNPLSALTPDGLPALSGRPLFSASRRPPPVEEEAYDYAAHEPTPLPGATLIGVVAAGGRTFALVSEGGTSRSLGLGDTLGDWTVASIGADSVTISDGEREETMRMFVAGAESPGEPEADRAGPGESQSDLAAATGEELLEMIRRRAN